MKNAEHVEPFLTLCSYLAGRPEAVQAFTAESGHTISTKPLDVTIDDATGHGKVICKAYLHWVAKNHYGAELAPDIDMLMGDEPTNNQQEKQ